MDHPRTVGVRARQRAIWGSLALATSLFWVGSLAAQPATIPIQGYVTTSGGAPIDGVVAAEFRLYSHAEGGAPFFVESVPALSVDAGWFSAYLGEGAALNLGFFDGDDVFLGVALGGEPELSPRVALGSVAYAAYSGFAGAVDWDTIENVPTELIDGTVGREYFAAPPLILNPSTLTFGLSSVGCSAGEGWLWNGATWICDAVATTTYTGGLGIEIDGAVVRIDAPTCTAGQYSRWSAAGWVCATDQTGLTSLQAGPGIGVAGNTISVAATTCPIGHYSRWNGTSWVCHEDLVGSFQAGAGIDIAGEIVSVDAVTCAAGQYSRWNGTAFVCATDQTGLTSITPGPGVSVAGSTVSINAPGCSAGQYSRWTGTLWQCHADDAGLTGIVPGAGIQVTGSGATRTVATTATTCGAGQYSYWNGTQWLCRADAVGLTALTGGAGISVAGSTISTQAQTCGANQYSYWDGAQWRCRADLRGVNSVVQGNGISVSTVGENVTVATSAQTCTATQYSYWDGAQWRCRTDEQGITTLSAGTGITITGSGASRTIAVQANQQFGVVPIGTIVAWTNHLAGTPALPAGWVRCDGQTLSDAASPLNGRVLPNLNGGGSAPNGAATRGYFLRGHSSSGLFESDQGNTYAQIEQSNTNQGTTTGTVSIPVNGSWSGWMRQWYQTTGGDSLRFRNQGWETRPRNMSVIYIMRVK